MLDKKKEYNVVTVHVQPRTPTTHRQDPNGNYFGIDFVKYKACVKDTKALRDKVELYPDLRIVDTDTVKYKASPRHDKGGQEE